VSGLAGVEEYAGKASRDGQYAGKASRDGQYAGKASRDGQYADENPAAFVGDGFPDLVDRSLPPHLWVLHQCPGCCKR
jgi:hypothetical protein